MAATAGLSAGARLLRLELLASRQSQALLAAERQIAKLNTRARLLGKDLQPPLRQVWLCLHALGKTDLHLQRILLGGVVFLSALPLLFMSAVPEPQLLCTISSHKLSTLAA